MVMWPLAYSAPWILLEASLTSAEASRGRDFIDPNMAGRSPGLRSCFLVRPSFESRIMGRGVWFIAENFTSTLQSTGFTSFETGAQAPDGLGQGASGQPGIPATPPDHQTDRQRCDRASFQAGSPCSQPPLTVCISPGARSHAAWRIAHYDQWRVPGKKLPYFPCRVGLTSRNNCCRHHHHRGP